MGDSGAIVSSDHATNGSKTQTGETIKHLAELIPQQGNSVMGCRHAFLCVHVDVGTHVYARTRVSVLWRPEVWSLARSFTTLLIDWSFAQPRLAGSGLYR